MKFKKVLAASFLFLSTVVSAAEFTGAGATFPFPIYAKWAEAYKAQTGIGLNYQSIGSGGGSIQLVLDRNALVIFKYDPTSKASPLPVPIERCHILTA